jgi:hypothetical protein
MVRREGKHFSEQLPCPVQPALQVFSLTIGEEPVGIRPRPRRRRLNSAALVVFPPCRPPRASSRGVISVCDHILKFDGNTDDL